MSDPAPAPQLASSSNVDRFLQLPNPSQFFYNYPLYAPARCCPPHRCSGRPPLDTYDLVERHIQSLALSAASSMLLAAETNSTISSRLDILQAIAQQVNNFDNFAIPLKRLETIISDRVIFNSQFTGERNITWMAKVLQCVGISLRASLPSVGAIMCLCDLTHLCLTAEELDRLYSARISDKAKNTLQQISERVTQQDISQLVHLLDGTLSRSSECGRRWAQRTKSQKAEWVKGMLVRITPVFADVYFPLNLACWSDALQIFGAARILEEFWTEPSDDSTLKTSLLAMEYFMQDVNLDPATTNEWKDLAKKCAVSKSNLVEAIGFYDYVTLLNPIDAQTRLNLAGARLRVANDLDQRSQWSRAINDCTLALYYGPPSLKAYYRRGFALAHLELWDKAILDYQEALRIEPHNVLIKLLLKNARAKRLS